MISIGNKNRAVYSVLGNNMRALRERHWYVERKDLGIKGSDKRNWTFSVTENMSHSNGVEIDTLQRYNNRVASLTACYAPPVLLNRTNLSHCIARAEDERVTRLNCTRLDFARNTPAEPRRLKNV